MSADQASLQAGLVCTAFEAKILHCFRLTSRIASLATAKDFAAISAVILLKVNNILEFLYATFPKEILNSHFTICKTQHNCTLRNSTGRSQQFAVAFELIQN